MKFNELSNKELVFTSIIYKDMLSVYEKALDAGGIEHVLDSPLGKVHIFKEFTSEEIETLEDSPKLKMLRSVVGKLEPIVDLILDSNPEMENELELILFGEATYDGEEDEDL